MAQLSNKQPFHIGTVGKLIDKKIKENPKLNNSVPSVWSSNVYEKDKRKPITDLTTEDLQSLIAHTYPNPPWIVKDVKEGLGILSGPTGTMYYNIKFGQLFWAESFEQAFEKVQDKRVPSQIIKVK